jgi:hypothetical protein
MASNMLACWQLIAICAQIALLGLRRQGFRNAGYLASRYRTAAGFNLVALDDLRDGSVVYRFACHPVGHKSLMARFTAASA